MDQNPLCNAPTHTKERIGRSSPREFMEDDGQEKHMQSGHWYWSA